MHDDDLSDVRLEGRTLVSDNTAEWIIPPTLNNFDDPLQWWCDLAQSENDRQRFTFDKETRAKLLFLAEVYSQVVSCGDGRVAHQAKIRSVVRQAVGLGLSTEQAARLFGVSVDRVWLDLFCNEPNVSEQLDAKKRAERMLRDGATKHRVAAATGQTWTQVDTLARAFNIWPRDERYQPLEARGLAISLRRSGMRNRDISKALQAHGFDVPAELIAQWWRRYGKTEQVQS